MTDKNLHRAPTRPAARAAGVRRGGSSAAPGRRRIVCVDFDRTIHDMDRPVPGWKMGAPIEGALEAVEVLQQAGYEVIVLTAHTQHDFIRDWLRYYGFPNLWVTNVKPVADLYIDDRAVRFEGDWRATLAEIERVRP